MAQSPVVSVVMGAFNAQRYLQPAVESLLGQTFTDFELIVVDDGSTDRTAAILERFAKADTRVRPIRIKHAGIVAAANTCIRAARAELIARADADDVQMPTRLQMQADFMMQHPDVAAVGARMIVIEPFGSPIRYSDHKLDHDSIESDLLSGVGWALPQPVAMLRRSVALQVGGYREDYPWSEDIDFFLRVAETGKLANLPDFLVRYRVHPNSTNWQKHQIQRQNCPRLLAEAHARRGLPAPADRPRQPYWRQSPAERFVSWVWFTLKDGNIHAARRHAWSAVKAAPLREQSWRAAYCALRGR